MCTYSEVVFRVKEGKMHCVAHAHCMCIAQGQGPVHAVSLRNTAARTCSPVLLTLNILDPRNGQKMAYFGTFEMVQNELKSMVLELFRDPP